jgi:hypothetical protein
LAAPFPGGRHNTTYSRCVKARDRQHRKQTQPNWAFRMPSKILFVFLSCALAVIMVQTPMRNGTVLYCGQGQGQGAGDWIYRRADEL